MESIKPFVIGPGDSISTAIPNCLNEIGDSEDSARIEDHQGNHLYTISKNKINVVSFALDASGAYNYVQAAINAILYTRYLKMKAQSGMLTLLNPEGKEVQIQEIFSLISDLSRPTHEDI